jgi:hypothetical protein
VPSLGDLSRGAGAEPPASSPVRRAVVREVDADTREALVTVEQQSELMLRGPVALPSLPTVGDVVWVAEDDHGQLVMVAGGTTAVAPPPAPDAVATAALAVLKESPPNPKLAEYGATGDGTTDDTAALAAFLAAGKSSGYVPPGTYRITAPLILPAQMDLRLDPAAKIRATAAMNVMLSTPVATNAKDRGLRGGALDCNGLANTGFKPGFFQHYTIQDLDIFTPLQHGVILGDVASASLSYEAEVHNVRIWAGSRTPPAGYAGLYIPYASDCEVMQVIVVGSDVGIQNGQGDNRFVLCHAWGHASQPPSKCFIDSGGNGTYIACTADTPSLYGWDVQATADATNLIGCEAYNNNAAGSTDNVAMGVHVAANAAVQSFGLVCRGQDAAHRWAKDFDFAGSNTLSTILATRTTNVVTTSRQRVSGNGLPFELNAHLLHALSRTSDHGQSNFQQSARNIYLTGHVVTNGQDGGTIASASGATTGRPASPPTGGMWFDTTLGKPIWWNGTAWKDATGATV